MKGLLPVLLVAALMFGVCYLVDKGFQKLFRSQEQHKSGLSVRPNKKYGAFGLIFFVVGLSAVFIGMPEDKVLMIGGMLVMLMGICLVVYYMSTGLFYDEQSFIYTSFGKKSVVYHYRDIQAQQLYNSQGSLVVELFMSDGKSVSIHGNMNGAFEFLDKAFYCWCVQRGMDPASCEFHDPANSCWFPAVTEEG